MEFRKFVIFGRLPLTSKFKNSEQKQRVQFEMLYEVFGEQVRSQPIEQRFVFTLKGSVSRGRF